MGVGFFFFSFFFCFFCDVFFVFFFLLEFVVGNLLFFVFFFLWGFFCVFVAERAIVIGNPYDTPSDPSKGYFPVAWSGGVVLVSLLSLFPPSLLFFLLVYDTRSN